jgi:hypothetical protein
VAASKAWDTMRWGLSGQPLPEGLAYGSEISAACAAANFPACFAYAIAWRETIRGERNGKWDAATVVSADGGHGLFQLTSYVPNGWSDPLTNAEAALKYWLLPNVNSFYDRFGLRADALVKAAADAFNRGYGAVSADVSAGRDPDRASAGGNYGSDVLAQYHRLVAGNPPS